MGSNVPEFQAQVLPSDGDLGAPFPRARHWDDLQRKRGDPSGPKEHHCLLAAEARAGMALYASVHTSSAGAEGVWLSMGGILG